MIKGGWLSAYCASISYVETSVSRSPDRPKRLLWTYTLTEKLKDSCNTDWWYSIAIGVGWPGIAHGVTAFPELEAFRRMGEMTSD